MRKYIIKFAFKFIAIIFIVSFLFGIITGWACYSGFVCLYDIMLFMLLFFITTIKLEEDEIRKKRS